MNHLTNYWSTLKAICLLTIMSLILTSSCVYRFTNRHVAAPAGIRTIAVEAIYDTSHEVLPHELLWDSLQKAFARDGHLRLTAQRDADALVRAHLTTATIGPTGTVTTERYSRDPDVTSPAQANPREFRRLPRAGEHTREELLSMQVRIEVIDLRTQKILLNRTYSGNRRFRTERAGLDIKGFYLIYEEALENRFLEISENIATRVVEDLLISF